MDATTRRSWSHPSRTRSRMIARTALPVAIALVLAGCSDTLSDPHASIEAQFTEAFPASPTPSAALARDRDSHAPSIYAPEVSQDTIVQALAFPTGSLHTSTVLLHQVSPRSADLNQPFVLEYHVTNLTLATLDEVAVHLHELDNLTLLDSSVHPQLSDSTLFFSLGRLGPGQTRVVSASARATSVGPAQTTATVTYRNLLRSQTSIVEPVLELKKSAPAFAATGDVFELNYTLTNTGTGTAKRALITDTLPVGVTTLDGKRRVTLPVLAIGPGQTEHRTVRVRAAHTGTFVSSATVTAASEVHASSAAPIIEVLDPVITLSSSLQSHDQHASRSTYRITLANTSRVRAKSARVTIGIDGASLFSASVPAIASPGSVTLGCELLEPGQSQSFELVLSRIANRALSVHALAKTDHSAPVTSSAHQHPLAQTVALATATQFQSPSSSAAPPQR